MSDLSHLPCPVLSASEQERLHRVIARTDVQTLLALLNGDNATTLIVGGAIRNALLDRTVADIDLATTLTPEAVQARAHASGIKTIATGIEHGTLTLVCNGHAFEVTTLRKDIETDGRRATIAYSTSFAEDAERRDFTMNALYANQQGVVYDPVAGLDDLRHGHLRFIGDPHLRIREDYLRILRFFRFFADYADGLINAAGLAACIALKGGLNGLSRERIGHEWLKILMARRACETVTLMRDHGLTDSLLPAAIRPDDLAALLDLSPDADAMLRLFALLDPDPHLIDACQNALRLSNTQTARLRALARALQECPDPLSAAPPHRTALLIWAFRHTAAVAGHALTLYAARTGMSSAALARLRGYLADMPSRSPFSGRDLLAAGIKSGPHLGNMLQTLDISWIKAGFPADPATVQALIRRVVNQETDLPPPDPQ